MNPPDTAFIVRFLAVARRLGPAFTRLDLAAQQIDIASPEFAAQLNDLWERGLVEGAGVAHNLGTHHETIAKVSGVKLRLTRLGRTVDLARPALETTRRAITPVSGTVSRVASG